MTLPRKSRKALREQGVSDDADSVTREPQLAPPTAVIIRMVHQMVASRLRFRALLEVLRQGEFEYEDYLARYSEIRERDSQAMVAQLMFERDDFQALFGEWKKQDDERWQATPSKRVKARSKGVKDP